MKNKVLSIYRRISKKQLALIFFIVSLVLWSLSLYFIKLEIGFLGIIDNFPPLFYISIIFLLISSAILWKYKIIDKTLLFMQLIFVIIIIWLTPIVYGAYHPFYLHSCNQWQYFVRPIQNTGHIFPDSVWYHSWPSYWIFLTIQCVVVNLNTIERVAIYFPFLVEIFLLAPLYILLRNFIGINIYIWPAMVIFYLANWVGQDYISAPQIAAYPVIILFLFILTLRFSKHSIIPVRIIIIIIFAYLTTAHMLTVLAALFILVALLAQQHNKYLNLIILLSVFIGFWMMYSAVVFFDSHLSEFISRLFRIDILFGSGLLDRIKETSDSHIYVNRIRIFNTLIYFFITLSGIMLSIKKLKMNDKSMLLIGSGILINSILIGAAYGFETPERTWMFFLPIVSYFGINIIRMRSNSMLIFVFILFLCFPFHIISRYGNQAIDYFSPQFIVASKFLEHIPSTSTIYGRIILNYSDGCSIISNDINIMQNKLDFKNIEKDNVYLSLGNYEGRYFKYIYNKRDVVGNYYYNLLNAANLNRIYDNNDQFIFRILNLNKTNNI